MKLSLWCFGRTKLDKPELNVIYYKIRGEVKKNQTKDSQKNSAQLSTCNIGIIEYIVYVYNKTCFY